jgi:hypothetical protein
MYRVLVPSGHKRYGDPCESFPLGAFEQAVLSRLREVDPREILGEVDGPDNLSALRGELKTVVAKINELMAELDAGGQVASLAKVMRNWEARRGRLEQEIAAAEREAASPRSEAWGEARTLIDALNKAPDQRQARIRMRSILRRLVDSIWVLLTHRGADRLASVQVWFAGCTRFRRYRILSRQARRSGGNIRPARWWASSSRANTYPDLIDLRKPEDIECELDHLKNFHPDADE